MHTRAEAQSYDAKDPLRDAVSEFVVADPELIYLDGNSLGRLPVRTIAAVEDVVRRGWGRDLVSSWQEWLTLGREAGDELAHLIGAQPGEVILCDQTSVNLFKLAMAGLGARRRRDIVTDVANFPSDKYVLADAAGLAGGELRLIDSHPIYGPTPDDVADVLQDAALLSLSHVGYRSGAIADMAAINEVAHSKGALTLWDLSHSAGALSVELDLSETDMAVGCTYKYLNGGPGAPAFIYVTAELQEVLDQPIHGWFGHEDQFAFSDDYVPAADVRRFSIGTPPVISMVAAREGIRLTAEIGIGLLRVKSKDLTNLAIELFFEKLSGLGFGLASPRNADARGSHVTLTHNEAWRINQALIEYGVIPDFRAPDALRLGIAPAYTSATQVWDAMERLTAIVESGTHKDYDPARGRVT